MILYGAPYPAPNPRRVRIFLAEKGIDLPETPVDMMAREHKSPEHRARNSLGQVPTLVLDDGTAISDAAGSSSVQTTALAAGRRARVTPSATMRVSQRIGAPLARAALAAAAAFGEKCRSAATSGMPQA